MTGLWNEIVHLQKSIIIVIHCYNVRAYVVSVKRASLLRKRQDEI